MNAPQRPRPEGRSALAWGTTWGVGVGMIEAVAVSPLSEGGLLEHVI